MTPRARPRPPALALAVLVVLAAIATPATAHDDFVPTLRALDAAIARAPGDVGLWLRRAELARLAGDGDDAARSLERAARLAPDAPSLALCRAALAFDRGALDEAARHVDRALGGGLPPAEIAGAHLLAARIAVARGREAEALPSYERAFALDPHPHADVALERATLALGLGRTGEARRGLAAARARLPHDRALAETSEALSGEPSAPDPVRPSPAAFAAASAAVAANAILLPRGSTWRWSATGAEPAGWAAPGYDDTGWASGPAALGYGDPWIVSAVPMGPTSTTRYWTTYFRTRFTVTDPPATFTGLTLLARYDDGFLVRLNGQEIARRALPAGPIGPTTAASLHEAGTFETIDVTAAGLPRLVAGENVLAVEVHQATSTSSDLTWDGELVAVTGAPGVIRGPWLQSAAPEAITVRWRTNVPTDSRLWLGPAPGALAVAATDTVAATEHEMRLTGLSPGTRHFYAVGSTAGPMAGDDSVHAFVTPPPAGEARPTRIWVLGDSGLPGPGQDRVRDAYVAWTDTTRTDVWLMLGDNAYSSGTDAEYEAGLFAPYREFLRGHCLWPTRGNHDFVHAGDANDYYDLFSLPTAAEAGGVPSSTEAWYSFDHGDIHFVCLDSEGSSRAPGSAMLTWLAADLAATDRTWVIAYWHHPPYTKGSHDSDNVADSQGRMRDMRENVLPVLEAHGVDLVLGGHSHSYERSHLLDGHYGTSGTLLPSMILDAGDGDPDGDGAYTKPTAGSAPHEGEVVAVAGSSSHFSGGTLDHPVMVRSLDVLGSMVIDVDGDRLRGTFLDDLGAVRDRFELRKGGPVAVPGKVSPGGGLRLRVAGPNPAPPGGVRLAYELLRAGDVRLSIVDAGGRRVRALPGGRREAGPHAAAWDGRDEAGRRAPAGLYFALLDLDGARETARIVLVP
jgi:hypothetical protein